MISYASGSGEIGGPDSSGAICCVRPGDGVQGGFPVHDGDANACMNSIVMIDWLVYIGSDSS